MATEVSPAHDADHRLLRLLRDARRQLELERRRRAEPIAVVGIGCRLPGGVSSPEQFWDLLVRGLDATSEVPLERWDAEALYDPEPMAPGKCYATRGGFLDRVDGFEPEFFGISEREARSLDPQQRLLLEVVWEALEDAGIPPGGLRGSATGVWIGLSLDDYARRSVPFEQLDRIDAYTALGSARSVAAGRLGYVLGVHGPVVQLDTACSSSLVALHLACQSLRSGESELALVGGVNVMSSPEASVALCRLRALSADGRCKTFDAAADGYGRGEGCGIVVLKTLTAAQEAGDRIWAVIRGSAVNHDGASNGLTAPNGIAQEAALRTALANAGIEAASVDYVEAHGTGTLLGDPVEVLALNRVYGSGRSAGKPLFLGSVKTNVAHLEAAAGIVALIKTALCLSHAELVPHLHFKDPNPKIPWKQLSLQVNREGMAWPRGAELPRAGVSAFGISGTNAHVVLEAAPEAKAAPAAPTRSAELVVLSARTESGLVATAQRLREHLEQHPEIALGDLAYNLATTRTLLERRVTLVVPTRQALLAGLEALGRGERPAAAVLDEANASRGKLAWLFTGQGAQHLGMGEALHGEWPVFQAALDAACATLDAHLERPLREVMWARPHTPEAEQLHQTAYTQPALFALEWALAALFRSWGVRPDFVAGHSIGEVTAACVAGVFTLADAARLVCARGRLMQALPRGGAMVAIAASKAEVASALGALAARVTIAAVNAPSSLVIAGEDAAVSSVAEQFAARGVETKRLKVSHAFHSALMDPMLEDFRRVAEAIAYHLPSIPMVSNLSGALSGSEVASADYWVRHVRQAVQFAEGVQALQAAGVGTFLELGPKATLLPLVAATLAGHTPRLLACGRAGGLETEEVLKALGGWIAQGGALDWKGIFPAGGRRVKLPTYAWQRQRYWVEPAAPQRAKGVVTEHPLLGVRLSTAGTTAVYETVLSSLEPAWLSEHRVAGQIVVPGAALVELVRAAAEDHREGLSCEVTGMVLALPLLVPQRGAVRVQVLVTEDGTRASVYSQEADADAGSAWIQHARASVGVASDAAPGRVDLTALRGRCDEALDPAVAYASFAAAGLDYGKAFRGLKRLWRGRDELLAEVELAEGLDPVGYGMHPALLDAALQALAGLVGAAQDGALLPFGFGRFAVHRIGASSVLVHARLLEPATAEGLLADLTLADAEGNVVAEIGGLHARRADLRALAEKDAGAVPDALYRLEWRTAPSAPSAVNAATLAGRWAVVSLGDETQVSALVAGLEELGATAERVDFGQLPEARAEHVVCAWGASGDAEAALQAAAQGLAVVQALSGHQPAPRLWWVTRAAVAVKPDDAVAVAGSSVWGLGRTLMQELPELRCTLVDLERAEVGAEVLAREEAAADGESQVAWRAGQRHAARLVRAPALSLLPQSENYQLESQREGTLDGLKLVTTARRAPGAGEVELEVGASGLNFRDVLIALGMYPGDAPPLGSECAGEVSRIGESVRGFAVGDRVMALGAGTFSRFVTVDARAVAPAPQGLSFEQAATLPIAFLTAWYALHDLAGLQRGERVLVHAAAGGVGMAAVQVARWIGAEVLATASAAKWPAVRELGVEHLASSRDLSFVEAFRSAPGALDVVLNSLAGQFVDAGLSLLTPGGRFIEMGKADIRDSADVAAAHPGVVYRAFDLLDAGLDRIAEMFRAVCEGFTSGHLKPLPVRAFPVTEAETAFRFMAQARHIGKLALKPAREPLRAQGTLLVTGGLGALGLQVARALAERGVPHLLLTGRRGLSTPGAAEAVSELEALGSKVTVAALDVADRAALARVIAAIPAKWPLRGVVHAAGVLDDGVLSQQTPERFARVMAPKVLGAWNLHSLTEGADLDLFVLFSSIAGTLGSAGQAGYAAGNSFLDALAAQRRAQGLSGLSLAWGPWAEQGLAATLNPQQQARFARLGLSSLTGSQGLALFERSLSRPEAALLLAHIDVRRLAKAFGASVPPLWQSLVRTSAQKAAGSKGSWARELLALPSEQRTEAVTAAVQAEVARVLSFDSAREVPIDKPLKELGLDSLMAVELTHALERRTGSPIPATLAFKHPNVRAIGRYLLESMLDKKDDRRVEERAITAYCEQLNRVEQPKVRLFCFHDAGGSATLFAPLSELGEAGVEIHAVSHARVATQNTEDAERYLRDTVAYINRFADKPFGFLGHSLGCRFAWRVIQELDQLGRTLPALFLPSGLPPTQPLDSSLPPAEIGEALWLAVGNTGQPNQVRAAFIADVLLGRSMPEPQRQEPLPVPIAALLGSSDPISSAADMQLWSQLSTLAFSLTVLPGDHFYLRDERSRRLFIDEVARRMSALAI